MKVVVQRVLNSSVVIDDKYEEKINKGLMILLGMTYNDCIEDIDYLVNSLQETVDRLRKFNSPK